MVFAPQPYPESRWPPPQGAAAARQAAAGYALRAPPSAACRAIKTYTTSWDINQPKQFRRCYQGLLSGYFGFERNLEKPGAADQRWIVLRQWLADQLDPLLGASLRRGVAPEWLKTLATHRNLLTADPCSRYAAALARDDTQELRSVCKGLLISGSSWVWHDALTAYVKLICQEADDGFKPRMPAVLQLVNGRTEVVLPPVLAVRTTAQIVTRYAHCTEHPEHADLRDTCVEWIGNPWLKRTAWDAMVNHEPARVMVNGWLKDRLIRDFFELLAADGAADLRRLHYWLQWAPKISDMWLLLGKNAYRNRSAAYLELRKRAGRDRQLVDSNPANNAFVMRIGPLLVIEFGTIGNACYAHFDTGGVPDLERPSFRASEFRQEPYAAQLRHQGSSWEQKFDDVLTQLVRQRVPSRGSSALQGRSADTARHPKAATRIGPDVDWSTVLGPAAPAEAAARVSTGLGASSKKRAALSPEDTAYIAALCEQHGLEWEDNRPKNGAFWVLIPDTSRHQVVSRLLERIGFQFKAGTGYWIKGG